MTQPVATRIPWSRLAAAALGALLLVSGPGAAFASNAKSSVQFESDAGRSAARDKRIRELRTVPVDDLSKAQLDELVHLLNERAHWREPVDHVVVYGGAALGFAGGGGRGTAGVRASRSRSSARSGSLASRSRKSSLNSSSRSSRGGSSFGSSSFGSSSKSSFGSSSLGSSSSGSSFGSSSLGSSSLGAGMH